jgi:hypothetical protein
MSIKFADGTVEKNGLGPTKREKGEEKREKDTDDFTDDVTPLPSYPSVIFLFSLPE